MTDFEEFIRDEKLTRLHQTHTPDLSVDKQDDGRVGARGQKRSESYEQSMRDHERVMQEKQQKLKELQELLQSVTFKKGNSPRKGDAASEGHGEPVMTDEHVSTLRSFSEEQLPQSKEHYYVPLEERSQYKGGGGAPLRDPITGVKQTRLNGRAYYDKLGFRDSAQQQRREQGREYLQKLMFDIEIQGQRKREETRKLHEETTDLASWIRSRDTTQRNRANRSQDVQQQDKEALRTVLTMQAEERHRVRELERMRDQYEARKYADMFPTLWGRERRLEKQEVHPMPQQSASPPETRPIYPKGTLTSNHSNRYENGPATQRAQQGGHVLEPPWGSLA